MNNEMIEMILANRRFLYELGNRIFGGVPNEEFLRILASEQTALAFELYSESEDDIYARTVRFLGKLGENLEKEGFVDYVRSEFMRVIEGPGKLKAYPWASTFLGREQLLFQECTLTVRATYKKYGMQINEFGHAAEDHIAIELHFMARMTELAQEALEKGDMDALRFYLAGQADFLRSHMTFWVPMYAEAMQKNEDAKVYPCLTAAYSSFLKDDLAAVDEILLSLMN